MDEGYIAKRITQLRLKKGVSARSMSLSIGQNPVYINNIESGKALPSVLGLLYICDYLQITPMEFFDVLNELSNISVAMVQMAFAADRNRLIEREAYWESVKRVNEQINVLLHQMLLREEEQNE